MTDLELLNEAYAVMCFFGPDTKDTDLISRLRELESLEPGTLDNLRSFTDNLVSYWINSVDDPEE